MMSHLRKVYLSLRKHARPHDTHVSVDASQGVANINPSILADNQALFDCLFVPFFEAVKPAARSLPASLQEVNAVGRYVAYTWVNSKRD